MTRSQPSPSATFDPKRIDAYLTHLATVGETLQCVAQEDIYNSFGLLLIAKGLPINHKTALRLAGHYLVAPITSSVGLAKQLTAKSLLDALFDLIERHKDLSVIEKNTDGAVVLRHLCMQQELPLALMQRLTVMAHQFPRLFERTLAVTILAVWLGKRLMWNNTRLYSLFVAALFRDIGLLHVEASHSAVKINDTILQYSKETLWHPEISARIVACEKQYDKSVIELLADHHERQDGTGYPKLKYGANVSDDANIISSMDTIWSVREVTKLTGSVSLTSIRLYLMANAYSIGGEPIRELVNMLRQAQLTTGSDQVETEYEKMVEFLISRVQSSRQICSHLSDLYAQLQTAELPKRSKTVSAMIANVLGLVRASGFCELANSVKLHNDAEEFRYSADELAEMDQIQVEFLWRIKRLLRLFQTLIEECREVNVDAKIIELSNGIAAILESTDCRSYYDIQKNRA